MSARGETARRLPRVPRPVRRLARRLRRSMRPSNLLGTLSVLLSFAVIYSALSGPPPRGSAGRTDQVLKALGLPPEEAGILSPALDPVPTLSASPRFVLPLIHQPERWAVRTPLRQPPVVATIAPPATPPAGLATAPLVVARPAQAPLPVPIQPAPAQPAPAQPAQLQPPAPSPPPASVTPPAPVELAARNPEGVPLVAPRPQLSPAPQLTTAVVMPSVVPRRAPALPPGGTPELAIVIDDIGPAAAHSQRATKLPRPATLAFLPYAEGIPALVAQARAHGHEIFVHLPMEPEGPDNPGPNAILVGLGPSETERRLDYAFSRVPEAVGLNNHMGSRATSDPASMLEVLQAVQRHGLIFVDSRTSPLSVGSALADRLGVPNYARDVFLDNDPSRGPILRQLGEAERTARRHGRALAIGHPYPTTLAVLEEWMPSAEQRGIRLVHASELIRQGRCQPRVIEVSGCVDPDCQPAPGC